jgi:hypothetical protein
VTLVSPPNECAHDKLPLQSAHAAALDTDFARRTTFAAHAMPWALRALLWYELEPKRRSQLTHVASRLAVRKNANLLSSSWISKTWSTATYGKPLSVCHSMSTSTEVDDLSESELASSAAPARAPAPPTNIAPSEPSFIGSCTGA